MTYRILLIAATAIASLPVPATAQLFSYEREGPRPTQSLSFLTAAIGFSFDGESDPETRFDFDARAYGAAYTRPSFSAWLLLGADEPVGTDRLRLIDASISTWAEIGLSPSPSQHRNRAFIPVMLHSNHRRVAGADAGNSAVDAFSVTVLGIGTGFGFNGHLGRLQIETRATPVIGFATRSFGDATGSSILFDGDLLLHFGPLLGRVGLSAGYGFRTQRWNVGGSDLLQDEEDDLFDYRGSMHLFRAGINW